MKKINALIRPLQWEEARSALKTLGVAVSLREVRTFGHLPARREVYRGSAYVPDTATELELTMLVPDELLESTLLALEAATTEAEIIVTSVERFIAGRKAEAARSIAVVRTTNAERPRVAPPALAAARA